MARWVSYRIEDDFANLYDYDYEYDRLEESLILHKELEQTYRRLWMGSVSLNRRSRKRHPNEVVM